mgnify:CR=1 FL=1
MERENTFSFAFQRVGSNAAINHNTINELANHFRGYLNSIQNDFVPAQIVGVTLIIKVEEIHKNYRDNEDDY